MPATRSTPPPCARPAASCLRRPRPLPLNRTTMRSHLQFQTIRALAVLCAMGLILSAPAAPAGMTQIPTGNYTPLFRAENDSKSEPVKSFYLDMLPVTNADFLEFVKANPRWQRSRVKRIFADVDYLK